MSREQRKLDHIKYALKLGDGPLTNGLENVHFVHNCLPELNPQDIVLSSQFGGIFFLSPFLINAVTGGADAVTKATKLYARNTRTALFLPIPVRWLRRKKHWRLCVCLTPMPCRYI